MSGKQLELLSDPGRAGPELDAGIGERLDAHEKASQERHDKQKLAALNEARQERDDGIEKAIEHADAVVENWSTLARGFLDLYALELSDPSSGLDSTFTSAAFQRWAESNGLAAPASRWAYGGVMTRACKSGLIVKCGHAEESYPGRKKTHLKTVTLWRFSNGK